MAGVHHVELDISGDVTVVSSTMLKDLGFCSNSSQEA
jgi:hypothetical protein